MPVHWVEFRRGFWIATTEVTYEQFECFQPEHRSRRWERTDRHPAVFVSWQAAREFCAWLSARSGRTVRLPSEAEWECACRAGTRTEYSFGDKADELPRFAWFRRNSSSEAQPVATKLPNAWGLYDMHGNVCEWCEDTFYSHLEGAPADGSARMDGDESIRVYRGGCCWFAAERCRSAVRPWFTPHRYYGVVGFRPAFSNPGN